MNYRNLKEAIDHMTEDQLDRPVLWWGEERGGVIGKITVLQEDYVDFGEGFEPSSGYDAEQIEDAERIIPRHSPVLIEE